MRKSLAALNLAVTAGLGISSVEGVQATTAHDSPVISMSLSRSSQSGVSGATIVQYAMKFLGYPYTATGNSPSTGFSCIGFVSYVYRSQGINLPGDLGGAMAFAPAVSFSSLLPGDILYFQNTVWNGLSHAAIYIGGGRFVHAEWYNRGVVTSTFTNDPVDGNYWTAHYLGANRPWTGATTGTTSPPTTVQQAPVTRKVPATPPPQVTGQIPSGPSVSVRVPSLNMRSGPALSASVLTVLVAGTSLTVLDQREGWYKVVLSSGATGWVIGAGIGKGPAPRQGAGVGVSANNSTDPPVLRAAAPTQTSSSTKNQIQGRVTVRVNSLRVHDAPSIDARVIGAANRGQLLPVIDRVPGWVKVLLPRGDGGWIGSQFVQSPTTDRTVSETNTIDPGQGAHVVLAPRVMRSTGGRSRRYRSRIQSLVTVTTSTSGRAGSVAHVALNMRRSPSLGGAIVSVLAPGRSYQILGWSHGWAHVRLSDTTRGWISGRVLGSTSTATVASGIPGSRSAATGQGASAARPVVAAGVRIHSGASLSGPAVGLTSAPTHVQVLSSRAGWARVRLPSHQIVYILRKFVRA